MEIYGKTFYHLFIREMISDIGAALERILVNTELGLRNKKLLRNRYLWRNHKTAGDYLNNK